MARSRTTSQAGNARQVGGAQAGAGQRDGTVQSAADELYGLPLDEFTAARNERAKQARRAGDSEAAAAIGKLAKPNVVAWLANQLVRERADEVGPLLELGRRLRQATASLDAGQLRQLSRQQHEIVYALVQQARDLANAAGQAVSDSTARGLQETLHAALADEHAAEELAQGRLTAGLSHGGFPEAGTGERPAGQRPVTGLRAVTGQRSAAEPVAALPGALARLERAKQDEADARRDAEAAVRSREDAQLALAQVAGATRAAKEDVDRVQAELHAALAAQAEASRAERQAQKTFDRADRAARQAERRLKDATARRQNLES